ncbi:MAG: PspC domain-containing protein [Candidatus Cryptobacteroides sp.]|nr:PspC domain-containing protein [Bacteroidales bacterium]MEE3391357.1 PspC domain-containing protein [Candidatus Cryptobacteroides sp.]MEE3430096.1 PspC domain-containing protein [Candidatus Cryptobacteroides sp.]
MNKVVSASVGGREFSFNEDAYDRLSDYFRHFKSRLKMDSQASSDEVMSEIERRVAELFAQATGGQVNRVVDYDMVRRVVEQLGMPDGSAEPADGTGRADGNAEEEYGSGPDFSYSGIQGNCKRKLFRDKDNKAIAGVCAGLAVYFDIDTTIIRVVTLLVCLLWGTGLIFYLVMMIVTPAAKTPYEKCLMHGLKPSAENMAKFSSNK